MNTKSVIVLVRSAFAASIALLAATASAATVDVNLTAQRMTAALPDGASSPMWGYCSTAACPTAGGGAWAPGPQITAAAGDTLVIHLTNSLPVPTSIVVLGQIGGGLGAPNKVAFPQHAVQTQTTWPGNDNVNFTPPAQKDRAMSFATEVAGGGGTTDLTWANLKPGTYIYETGTAPSLQAPMGLYGVLVVTQAPVATVDPSSFTPGRAYPGKSNEVAYDADAVLLFSEIDPVQNAAVDTAAVYGTEITKRFDDGTCVPNCYPAAVNYTPKYYLINGKSFDSAAAAASAVSVPSTYATGNVLVRLLNAGLRSHVPSIVGLAGSIVAEDGNIAPGKPKKQNEVLLPAGKTHDLVVRPAGVAATGYAPAAFAVFDRQLSLSAASQVNAGMHGYLQVAGGALPVVEPVTRMKPQAVADSFPVPVNATIGGNVRANDFAVSNAAVFTGVGHGSLSFYSDGTFAYTPALGFTGIDSFTYRGNDGTTDPATVTLNVGNAVAGSVVAVSRLYNSKVAGTINVNRPGVLEGASDGANLVLTAALAGSASCTSVSLNPNGSFTATGSGSSCYFSYVAVNAVNKKSLPATITVNFPTPSGLQVSVVDPATAIAITDYRWIIQEDLTFKADPSGTPSVATRTLGTSFHKSYMNLVASGCTGTVSCSAGQAVRGTSVIDRPMTAPGDVYLDPTKHYYISVLPNDAGDGGHAMGGAEIKPGQLAVTVNSNGYAWEPAQLSIFIYEDNNPVNNQNDGPEVNQGLGGFNIILMDPVGRSGDVAGQQTFDSYGMPLSNWLLGRTGCPDGLNTQTNGTDNSSAVGHIVGVVYTCPNDPNFGTPQADPAKYALAGHALIKNVTPARYDVIAHPGAAREGAGEIWWQTETLEGTPAQDAFTGVKEPVYFQEFGPPGFHTTIGFVNPDNVKKFAHDSGLDTGPGTVKGKITSQHMSRPSNTVLHDSGSYDLLSSTTCQVALNSQAGDGPAIAIGSCNGDGTFQLDNIPSGDYELVIWDQWLDQIIQFEAVTVPAATVAVPKPVVDKGDIPVLSWFTQYDQNIYVDSNGNGKYDAGEKGISNVTMTTRYRDGGISNQTATDSNGNGLLAELFPLFNWYVTEADTTRFKQTGVNLIVDAGGATDTTDDGAGLWSSQYTDCIAGDSVSTPCSSNRVDLPGAYSYGIQGFISQRTTINWGRTPYAAGENGGIAGIVVNSTTRPFDDQRYNVQTLWEPLVPRVQVNLYRRTVVNGVETLEKVDSTFTSSFDDSVNAVDPITGKSIMQCPGQDPADPFFLVTLGGNDQFRCYDGWHNWNQAQPAPYDGRYQFPSATYVGNHPLTAAQIAAKQTLVSLPPGDYVVEAVTPDGWDVVKEEDKNILNGDTFADPPVTQFAGIGNVFILPDQATLNNANPYNLKTADGFANNATTNLGVISSLTNQPECVGSLHRVPDYLSLFPTGGLVAPFAGMDRPLCDRKLVKLGDQMQASATFFVFTEVPLAANGAGIILDDASSEFNAAAPDFGEKASVPFVPVSIKDFNGREISRNYSDQWGTYNTMTPSSYLVNPPTPSGYGPNMLITCINDPGPIAELNSSGVATGRMITDPQYNPAYSNFCYTLPFMPGRTTYLDTPVLPIAAFAAGYNPADCAYPDATPAISRVDGDGVGPYVSAVGKTLTIKSLGDQQVQNPAYSGPFAANGPTSKRLLTRHYGFGNGTGKVTIGGISQNVTSWADDTITVTVAAGTPATSELVVTTLAGKSTIDAVTVTIEATSPKRVPAAYPTIQAAVDAATPGDLILIDAGTYNELVIMWKPVRLQGVGAASVIINAAKYPTSKLDVWRPTINSLFAIDGTTGNQTGVAQVDPLPTQEITGGVVLLEPSVLGTEEGAGITVLAKDLPANQCSGGATSTFGRRITESNFRCAKSRIDGVSITGGDSGGGIYVNGWAHNLEIANNRIYGNAGAFNGGVRVGIPYLQIDSFPTNAQGNVQTTNGRIRGLGYNTGVNIHHNAITKNGTVEAPIGSGGAGGGVSMCSGTDGYLVNHNWICGNFASSDGGGVGHIGFSQNGKITDNQILFNQSFQQTTSTHGGGIAVIGEPAIGGTVSLGTGDVTITGNVIRGNFAEVGHGGGIRLAQVNGADLSAGGDGDGRWHKVTIVNNIIDNNVAGYSGGGIALADALRVTITNNTVASNDSAGIAGSLLAGGTPLPAEVPGAPGTGTPSPAGISSELTSAVVLAELSSNSQRNANRVSQPQAFVNNVIWKNRSFYYSGDGKLCSANSANVLTCKTLTYGAGNAPEQATTGQCANNADYWDIGVVGDTSVVPSSNSQRRLVPMFSVLTSVAGYTGNSNLSADPVLQDLYCNGSRVMPELPSVINPPALKSLAVAATVDEGANYVNLRFGPLYTAKPTDSTGTAFAAFGDYHLASGNGSAFNTGTNNFAPSNDIDADLRPQFGRFDIGADEFAPPPPPPSNLSITKTDNRTTVNRGSVVTYSIVVHNSGATVIGATVNDSVPTVLTGTTGTNTSSLTSVTWTCAATAGSSCGTASGNNAITNRTVNLLDNGSATFTFTGTLPTTARNGATLTNTATVTAPAGVTDPNTANNAATDADTVTAAGSVAITVPSTARPTGSGYTNALGLTFNNQSGLVTATFTLTVTGSPVTFESVAVSTTVNAQASALFAKGATDTCSGQTIAVNGTCKIDVTFNAPPTNNVGGGSLGVLRVVDSATNSAQTVSLSGY